MSTQAAQKPAKLPLLESVGRAYAAMNSNFGQVLMICWLWLLVMTPMLFMGYWLFANVFMKSPSPAGASTLGGDLAYLVLGFLIFPFFASIAVAWHRFLLNGELPARPYLRLDSRVWIYALISLMILLIPILSVAISEPLFDVAGASANQRDVLILIPLLVGLLLSSRLSLILPAKAMDAKISIGDVWRATRGNTGRLLLGSFLTFLPILLMPILVNIAGLGLFQGLNLPARAARGQNFLIEWMAAMFTAGFLLSAVIAIVFVGFLSFAYRHFFQRSADNAAVRA
jgi:hypothetical protein